MSYERYRTSSETAQLLCDTDFVSFSVSRIPAVFHIVAVFRIDLAPFSVSTFPKKLDTAQVFDLHYRKGNNQQRGTSMDPRIEKAQTAILNKLNSGIYTEEQEEKAARAFIQYQDGIEFGLDYCENMGTEIVRVNTGDTYDGTLLRVDGTWIYSSLGDVIEEQEQDHYTDTGELRCGYCGEYSLPNTCHSDMGEEL